MVCLFDLVKVKKMKLLSTKELKWALVSYDISDSFNEQHIHREMETTKKSNVNYLKNEEEQICGKSRSHHMLKYIKKISVTLM